MDCLGVHLGDLLVARFGSLLNMVRLLGSNLEPRFIANFKKWPECRSVNNTRMYLLLLINARWWPFFQSLFHV